MSTISILVVVSLITLSTLAFGFYTGRVTMPARIRDSWVMGSLRNIDSGAFRGESLASIMLCTYLLSNPCVFFFVFLPMHRSELGDVSK